MPSSITRRQFVRELEGDGGSLNATGRNPRGPCPGKKKCAGARGHVIKGGSWRDDEFFSRIYNRNNPRKPYVVSEAGFRCAVSDPE